MVAKVKRLEAKLQRVPLSDPGVLEEREVPLRIARRKERVASHVAESNGEIRIDGVVRGDIPEIARRPVLGNRADTGGIGIVTELSIVAIANLAHLPGISISKGDNASRLPATDYFVRETRPITKRFARPKWQLVEERGDEPPALVELREPTPGPDVVTVSGKQRVAVVVPNGAARIN